ncbi:hypothetical protein [Pandoraea terrae]|uniref:hypothetical protein n=1 Tax=Pandoraea terrae TaxID=1537710 RepID=UPI001240B579|nr:hypothetical protein [Pandoraea terrae]
MHPSGLQARDFEVVALEFFHENDALELFDLFRRADAGFTVAVVQVEVIGQQSEHEAVHHIAQFTHIARP